MESALRKRSSSCSVQVGGFSDNRISGWRPSQEEVEEMLAAAEVDLEARLWVPEIASIMIGPASPLGSAIRHSTIQRTVRGVLTVHRLELMSNAHRYQLLQRGPDLVSCYECMVPSVLQVISAMLAVCDTQFKPGGLVPS